MDYFFDVLKTIFGKNYNSSFNIKTEGTQTITSMEEFYRELDKLLKPKPLGKALKDKKQRTAQSAYQKEQLGDAFIDNN